MNRLFDQFVSEVRRANPGALSTLRPGLSRDVVVEKLADLPYKISPDAVALYEWADGSDEGFELLPGGFFIPFERALSEFWILHPYRDEFESVFHQPYRDCFRFLSDWSDGGYAFGRLDSPSAGRIVSLCIHAQWRLGFANLEALLVTAIECYRSGVFPKDGSQEIPDFDKYFQIGRDLNPKMDWATHGLTNG